jgi:hypothetical protein
MIEGKDSEPCAPVLLDRAVSRLSDREQQLLTFALDRFGEQLIRFVLAGLGAEATEPRWRFAVAYTDGAGSVYERRVEVITHEPSDGSSLLPRGRDPLALLALLHLILPDSQGMTTHLRYAQRDVLEVLGWDDSEETRRELDDAIGRYSSLTYLSEAEGAELGHLNLASYKIRECPISSFSTMDEEAGEEGSVRRVFNQVVFNESFVTGLVRRSLLEIDWDRVTSVSSSSAYIRRR